MSNVQSLVQQFHDLGIRSGDVLLVHASMRSLGKLDGGAETFIDALLHTLGAQGTLLLPALSYETVTPDNPYFDVCHTPSCVGALTEYFRMRAGTKRSINPTHSVCAVGALMDKLLDGHEHDITPCGENSPFHKLPRYNGRILFVGCGLSPNTSIHAIEELVVPPYLYDEYVEYEITDSKNRVSKHRMKPHNFRGWVQRYDRLEQLLDHHALTLGKVMNANCHLVETSAMWDAAHKQLQIDPLFFVEREKLDIA